MTRWQVMLALMCGVALAPAADRSETDVTRLQLRAQAAVSGDTIRFVDVLVFGNADPELVRQIGETAVTTQPFTQGEAVVTYDQIVKRLNTLGVNLSRVLISGALQCRVTRRSADSVALAVDDAPLLRPSRLRDATGEKTLAELIEAHVAKELREPGGTPEIKFERAGQEFLRLTAPPWEFSVNSADREKLGLREFHVLIRRDGQVRRNVQVFGQVSLARPVVVARRPLSMGNFVRREDVGLETRVFDKGPASGLGQVDAVIGQQIKRFVPTGEMLQADALKSVDMVVRSRPVTVMGAGGNIDLRLTGVALDSGGYGETVRVRLGDARHDKQVLRGVVTGLGTVKLAEGGQ